jgi:hypothetical protein
MQPESPAMFFEWLEQAPRACPNCRYSLSGLKQPVCPECGVQLVLAVRPADARTGAFLAGMIGLSMGLGFGGIMGLLMSIFSLFGMRAGPDPATFYLVSFGGATAFGIAIFIWHRQRRVLRALSRGKRAAVAVFMWLLSAAYVVYYAVALTF